MSRERGEERECKHEARARGARGVWWGGRMIARNSSPGRCGAEGIIRTLPSLSPFPHLAKSVWEPQSETCWSSERSDEDAEAPLAFLPWKGPPQTSGLVLLTPICRRGGGARRFILWATEILHIPFYHLIHLPFCASSLCCFSPLLHHVSLAFYTPPPLWLFILILDIVPFFFFSFFSF